MNVREKVLKLYAMARALFLAEDSPQSSMLEFQPDKVLLEEQPTPFKARFTLHLLIAFILIMLTVSIFTKVDRIVTTQGQLASRGKTYVVQPLSQGVITDILVEEGQEVQEGDILVTMDSVFAQADMKSIQSSIASYKAQAARLQAMESNATYEPEDPTDRSQYLQGLIFKQRTEEYWAQMNAYLESIRRLEAQLQTQNAQLQHNLEQLGIAKKVNEMKQTVFDEGAISQMELLQAQSNFTDQNEVVDRLQHQLREVEHDLDKAKSQLEAYTRNWKAKINEELVDVNRELDRLSNEEDKANRIRELVNLRAMAHSVVLEIMDFSVGSVVEEAQTLVRLIPLDVPLDAEVYIRAQDIGFVRVGDSAKLKLSSFPFEEHGTVAGTISSISEGTFQQKQGDITATMYKAKISLSDVSLRDVPQDFRLIPGMTLSAEIKVGQRRLITYFLYPIIRSFDESMREP